MVNIFQDGRHNFEKIVQLYKKTQLNEHLLIHTGVL